MHEAHKATGTVAAMLNLSTIGIEDAIAEVSFRVRRGFHQKNLVGTDAEMPVCQRARPLGGHRDGLAHAVENDKVVAGAVHFGEGPHHESHYTERQRLSAMSSPDTRCGEGP